MTTELRGLRTALLALPIVFLGWVAVMAGVMLVSDAAPAAVAILTADDFIARLPEDEVILSRGRFHVTIQSEAHAVGRRLYLAGARLVLPAGLTGCLPMPG
jgi:hypothetical protein